MILGLCGIPDIQVTLLVSSDSPPQDRTQSTRPAACPEHEGHGLQLRQVGVHFHRPQRPAVGEENCPRGNLVLDRPSTVDSLLVQRRKTRTPSLHVFLGVPRLNEEDGVHLYPVLVVSSSMTGTPVPQERHLALTQFYQAHGG